MSFVNSAHIRRQSMYLVDHPLSMLQFLLCRPTDYKDFRNFLLYSNHFLNACQDLHISFLFSAMLVHGYALYAHSFQSLRAKMLMLHIQAITEV